MCLGEIQFHNSVMREGFPPPSFSMTYFRNHLLIPILCATVKVGVSATLVIAACLGWI